MSETSNEATRRPVLIVGGAPRLAVDPIRFMSVSATGATAVHLAHDLGSGTQLLLGVDAAPDVPAWRFRDRQQLNQKLRGWAGRHPDGIIVMSAAVNDYQVERVVAQRQGEALVMDPGGKIPSGCERISIEMAPASKLVDDLRGPWGFAGSLVAFKYEAAETVIASAQALRHRIDASLVVANSLCGEVQALLDGDGLWQAGGRAELLAELVRRLAALRSGD
ncbi:MAG: phosphopantothenoylcysteine decarboxylase [Planctomycetota bacterium]